MRATYHRAQGVRHLSAAYELCEGKLFGHVKPRKTRTRFLEFRRYLRTLYPPSVRIAIVCDNYSPHLSTRRDARVGDWAKANNVEFAYTPTNSSWLNRIEARQTLLEAALAEGPLTWSRASASERGTTGSCHAYQGPAIGLP
jgi:transposase